MGSGFSFRHKVRFSWGSRLPFDVHEWRFPNSNHDLRIVALQGADTLNKSEWVVLLGDHYETEDDARQAGEEARSAFERALALLRLGADFGDHYRGGLNLADQFKRDLEAEYGAPVLPDRQGLMIFPSDPRPRFLGFSARARVDPTASEAERALVHSGARVPLTDGERLAHQFFGASFFVDESPEARMLLLTAAIEALMDFRPRSDAVRALIDRWRADLQAASIGAGERDSILGSLGFLAQESISAAGRRLVATSLKGRRYADSTPEAFFRQVYVLRSRIAHPSARPPDRQEVVDALPHLQAMVGDLLAGSNMLEPESP